jgi:hypothetical protein
MSEEQEGGQVLLQKMDNHVGKNFPRMFLDHNEHGVGGTILVEMSKGMLKLYGEYSEMTPLLEETINAIDSGIYASASIGGKMRNSFLQKMYKITQVNGGEPMKKPGMLSGLEGLVSGQRKNLDANSEMRGLSGM